jgi:type III pantothenate kinase
MKCLAAVDIGNSQMKVGRFAGIDASFPEPSATLELPIDHVSGRFNVQPFAAWCREFLTCDAEWWIGSVHRAAASFLLETASNDARKNGAKWHLRQIGHADIPIDNCVDEPDRVGIDRLLAAVAVNRLRTPNRPAIVVDLGTATTVDLIEADGAFAGGAILPGIGMAARALADQTDALPQVMLDASQGTPAALGKSTSAAIEAGLYWGAVGAVNEIASQLAAGLATPPEIFVTGGAGRLIVDSLKVGSSRRYVPHLVLSGIALLEPRLTAKDEA